MVYLAIPVRQTGTKNAGQMIIHGLTVNAAEFYMRVFGMQKVGETDWENARGVYACT